MERPGVGVSASTSHLMGDGASLRGSQCPGWVFQQTPSPASNITEQRQQPRCAPSVFLNILNGCLMPLSFAVTCHTALVTRTAGYWGSRVARWRALSVDRVISEGFSDKVAFGERSGGEGVGHVGI